MANNVLHCYKNETSPRSSQESVTKMLNVTNAQLAVRGSVPLELSSTGIRAQTVLSLFTLQLLQAAQQLLFIHVVPTLLPLIPELLQRRPNLLSRGHPHLPQVVAADRERGHSPFLHFFQKLFFSLVLEELEDLGIGVSFPRLGEKRKKKYRVHYETAPSVLSIVLFPLLLVRQEMLDARISPASQVFKLSLGGSGRCLETPCIPGNRCNPYPSAFLWETSLATGTGSWPQSQVLL